MVPERIEVNRGLAASVLAALLLLLVLEWRELATAGAWNAFRSEVLKAEVNDQQALVGGDQASVGSLGHRFLRAESIRVSGSCLSGEDPDTLPYEVRYHNGKLLYYLGNYECALVNWSALASASDIPLYAREDAEAWSFLVAVRAGWESLHQGDLEDARRSFALALRYRPRNLYALYGAYSTERKAGQAVDPSVARQLLRYQLDDARLLTYLEEVITELLEARLWEPRLAQPLLSTVLWQHSDRSLVERIVGKQTEADQETRWQYLEKELAERGENSTKDSSTPVPRASVDQCTDVGPGVSIAAPSIDRWNDNLISNPDVEAGQGNRADDWGFFLGQKDPKDLYGWYVGGVDRRVGYSGQSSLRIKNLWRDPEVNGSPYYAEFRSTPADLAPNSTYSLVFAYRNADFDTWGGEVIVQDVASSGPAGYFTRQLPASPGTWRQTCYLFRTSKGGRAWIGFRNVEQEDLWIDLISLSRIP